MAFGQRSSVSIVNTPTPTERASAASLGPGDRLAGTNTEAVKAESEVEIKSVIGHALPEIYRLLGP
ncbi:hypothetical protein [Prescottella agglutinans]|uniref:PDZ domain-containing protein n=1 Tax=Prescottella agglutinans TaxID=1644129 RepID=A0ABT6M786_9NOCA|nr:hypothetical protein [Prescottella agglutinans]MDH6279764.1 hypothetical protein [Prescottella agglutinans]